MHKMLVAALAGAGAVSSAAALDSPREMEICKASALKECVNEANARTGNAANVADVILAAGAPLLTASGTRPSVSI